MSSIVEDFESCYRLSESRDPRYDGIFFIAATSTRLYCRPSCPARQPKRANVRFYPTAAAAQSAGFRACKRCRPDAAPGSPDWNWRADRVARAMRLIADGTVDREGVPGLARRLGFSERHLRRLLAEQVGATPVALARAQRANTARHLIESTAMPFADAAFAAGFHSVRQFNDTIRDVFASTPSEMRRRSKGAAPPPPGSRRPSPELPGTIRRRRPAAVPRSASRPRSRRGQRRHLSASAHTHSRRRGRRADPGRTCRPLRPPPRRSSRPRDGSCTLSALARPRRRPACHRRGARPRRGDRRPCPRAAGDASARLRRRRRARPARGARPARVAEGSTDTNSPSRRDVRYATGPAARNGDTSFPGRGCPRRSRPQGACRAWPTP